MPFKKLHPFVLQRIEELQWIEPIHGQKAALSKMKSGAPLFILGEEGHGKSTLLMMYILHVLEAMPFEDSPRALVVVENKEKALEFQKQFDELAKGSGVRTFPLYEEGNINYQKDEVYLGMDLIIATPKRLSKLYFLNGIHTGKLKVFAIEDADFLRGGTAVTDMDRLSQSMTNCQFLVTNTHYSKGCEQLADVYMSRAQEVEL